MDRKLNYRKRTREIKGIENGMQERMRKESERNDGHIWHVLRNKQVNNKQIKPQIKFGENVKEVYNI